MYLGFTFASTDFRSWSYQTSSEISSSCVLQFSTTSIVWELLALWNSSRSATLTVDVGPFYWWLKDNTMGALKFVLHFVFPACIHFALNTSFLIHLFVIPAQISCTISYTYVTAIHIITSPSSLHSPKSRYILLYFVQTLQCASPLSEPQLWHCRIPLSKITFMIIEYICL